MVTERVPINNTHSLSSSQATVEPDTGQDANGFYFAITGSEGTTKRRVILCCASEVQSSPVISRALLCIVYQDRDLFFFLNSIRVSVRNGYMQ